jgi:putative nucleotidyltransferase with HDIG domain
MSNRIRTYVGSLVLLAVIAATWVYNTDPTVSSDFIKAAGCFAVLSAICGMLEYQKVARSEAGSIAFLPIIASIIVAPSWITVAFVALATAFNEVFNRRALIKGVFNVSQAVFWVSIATLLYGALGGTSLLLSDAKPNFVAFGSTLLVFGLFNSAALAGAIAISESKRFGPLWWSRARVTVVYDLCTLPFVYLFAWCYVNFGPPGAVVCIIPFLGVRELYKVNWQLQQTNQELLQLMVAAIEARDPYTSGHSRRVARNSRLIAQAIGLRDREVERVAVAALLHDVGKIHEVFAPILSKPGKLTAEENAIMQTHPIKSAELVSNVSQLKDVIDPIRHHHENWDGTGYPDGVAGAAIPLASRIIMFADTIDAMTTDRPYRSALGEAQVRAEFVRLRGRQFDPEICDKLLESPIYSRLFDQDVPLAPVIAETERRKTVAKSPLLAG